MILQQNINRLSYEERSVFFDDFSTVVLRSGIVVLHVALRAVFMMTEDIIIFATSIYDCFWAEGTIWLRLKNKRMPSAILN